MGAGLKSSFLASLYICSTLLSLCQETDMHVLLKSLIILSQIEEIKIRTVGTHLSAFYIFTS